MTMEALKFSHLNDYSADLDDPSFDGKAGARLIAKALLAMATKIDVLTAKLNADAGVTDVNYAIDFVTVLNAVEYTES